MNGLLRIRESPSRVIEGVFKTSSDFPVGRQVLLS